MIRRLRGTAYFLENGRVVAVGDVDSLMGTAELVQSYFGGAPPVER